MLPWIMTVCIAAFALAAVIGHVALLRALFTPSR